MNERMLTNIRLPGGKRAVPSDEARRNWPRVSSSRGTQQGATIQIWSRKLELNGLQGIERTLENDFLDSAKSPSIRVFGDFLLLLHLSQFHIQSHSHFSSTHTTFLKILQRRPERKDHHLALPR
jgi:hypothetical protein